MSLAQISDKRKFSRESWAFVHRLSLTGFRPNIARHFQAHIVCLRNLSAEFTTFRLLLPGIIAHRWVRPDSSRNFVACSAPIEALLIAPYLETLPSYAN